MEKTYIKEGRFIPAMGMATDAERLRAVEMFLVRFSQETEYILTQLNETLVELSEKIARDGEVAQ